MLKFVDFLCYYGTAGQTLACRLYFQRFNNNVCRGKYTDPLTEKKSPVV